MPTETYSSPGNYQWDVPDEAVEFTVECYGAEGGDYGGDGTSGKGGYAQATFPGDISNTLYLYVGGANGYNGGGDGGGRGSDAGGGTDVRVGGTGLNDRILVAGGGGGAVYGEYGGDGGGLEGGPGESNADSGGTQTSGGESYDSTTEDGEFFYGGSVSGETYGGGGGGGGWYGGGSGGSGQYSGQRRSGGGGSGYIDESVAINADPSTDMQVGGNTGDGQIVITYQTPDADPPSVSVVDERDSEIDLDWDEANTSGGATIEGYNVYRTTDSSATFGNYTQIGSTTSTSYTDTNLTNGREYHYRVTTQYNGEESDPSDRTSGTTTLPSPTIVSATGGDRLADLEWSVQDNNTDGEIKIDRDGTTVETITGLSTVTHTDTGLLDGQAYEYTIRRVTPDTSSESSPETVLTDLPPVENLTVDDVNGRYATLSWSDQSNNTDHYEVLLSEDGSTEWVIDDDSVTGVSEGGSVQYVTTELLDGQQYDTTVETFTTDTSVREDQ
ncbi:glycine-rich protein [Natronorubrum sp. FCH18a]|uniref:glycine-rich protein n=1 Tax=Natronorubrum sp. FCH18a TaxID=3447018 RepID=UPI003F515B82